MALINCPECNHEVSDQAATCPNCGYILKTEKTTNVTSVASLPAKKKKKLGCLFYCSIIILILMTITIVGAVLGNVTPSSNNNTNSGNQNATLSTNAPTSFAAKNINGLSNKQGEKIDKILKIIYNLYIKNKKGNALFKRRSFLKNEKTSWNFGQLCRKYEKKSYYDSDYWSV